MPNSASGSPSCRTRRRGRSADPSTAFSRFAGSRRFQSGCGSRASCACHRVKARAASTRRAGIYPSLPSHPQPRAREAQMQNGGSGVVTFFLRWPRGCEEIPRAARGVHARREPGGRRASWITRRSEPMLRCRPMRARSSASPIRWSGSDRDRGRCRPDRGPGSRSRRTAIPRRGCVLDAAVLEDDQLVAALGGGLTSPSAKPTVTS